MGYITFFSESFLIGTEKLFFRCELRFIDTAFAPEGFRIAGPVRNQGLYIFGSKIADLNVRWIDGAHHYDLRVRSLTNKKGDLLDRPF
ncbi:hypothetical protein D3C72_1790350 [compost metagenome]